MRVAESSRKTVLDYIDVLKPRETFLLTFIGVCSAIIAAGGYFRSESIALALIAIGLGSAGCNGLTKSRYHICSHVFGDLVDIG